VGGSLSWALKVALVASSLLIAVPTPSAGATTVTPPDCANSTAPLCLITEPDQGFSQIYSLINGATSSIDLTMYELADPTAEQDLIAAQQRGVSVRVILDQAYNGGPYNQAAYDELAQAGVPVHWAPISIIFHQKTLTVDGAVSAIGTANLTAQYYATSRDFWVVDRQAPDVQAVSQTFDSDWTLPAGTPSISPGPPGTDLIWSPGSQSALVAVINGATTSLQVESEEMNSTAIESALEAAAARGVSVQVTMTASSSWEQAFTQLVEAGVQIHTYAQSNPFYIHAKAIVADYGLPDENLYLGSINFSTTSMQDNRELGLSLADPAILTSVHYTLASDFAGGSPYGATNPTAPFSSPFATISPTPDGNGYWLTNQGAQVVGRGSAAPFPATGGNPPTNAVVAMAASPDGGGYWLAGADGGVATFGDAPFFGSMAGTPLHRPVVGMAVTPDGGGYWLVGSDGGVFAFGDAHYFGSMGGRFLAAPVVGMATTTDGGGYWLVASDGGIFAYGDAAFLGSMGGRPLHRPVVGMAPNSQGPGYWLTAADGGVFALGGAPYLGSMAGHPLNGPVVGMAANPQGVGYWLMGDDGGVFAFGLPGFLGSAG
jgi:hypothetical protein